MLKDQSVILLSFFFIGSVLCGLVIYSRYLVPIEHINTIPLSQKLIKQEPIPDIIFDIFTVKTPSQDGFTLCATSKKAKIFKQAQNIVLSDLHCVCKKNDIFFGSINACTAIVNQQQNKITFHKPQTELNLSSDTQQTR